MSPISLKIEARVASQKITRSCWSAHATKLIAALLTFWLKQFVVRQMAKCSPSCYKCENGAVFAAHLRQNSEQFGEKYLGGKGSSQKVVTEVV